MKNNATEKAISELKDNAGLISDYALAKALNVPQSSIGRYSNGKTSITLDKLEKMADLLNKELIIKFKNK